ncbi:hypothetical protein GCM10020367_70500 [Streptomyces sannanensis]|uniref:Uncharacterized protein n=1 Tax=Streptomyces sannanensis TaxID=285536 RepID=A0ABP6SNK9_9ACTN
MAGCERFEEVFRRWMRPRRAGDTSKRAAVPHGLGQEGQDQAAVTRAELDVAELRVPLARAFADTVASMRVAGLGVVETPDREQVV